MGWSYLDEEALLHGSLIGGVGLIFFCLWLRRAANAAFATAVLVVAVGAVVHFALAALARDNVREAENLLEEQFFAAISPVCSHNQPVTDARGYVSGQLNSAVFFVQLSNDGALYPSRYGVTEEFQPSSVSELGLVICTTTSSLIHETCEYSTSAGDRLLSREQYTRTIQVVDPTTAQVLDTHRLEGSMPAVCPASRTFSDYEYSATNYGSLPSDTDVIEVIRPWLDGNVAVIAGSPPPAGGLGTSPSAGQPAPAGVKPGDEPEPTGKP